jgi:hypothetical protein
MKVRGLWLGWGLLWLAAWGNVCAADDLPRLFRSGSLAQIAQTRVGRPFVLILWSLQCSTCLRELDVLSRELRARPDTDLVLVSTDRLADGGEASAVLEMHEVAPAESWIFADSDSQRLRYEIDPAWFGEVPRAYFYDPRHQRTAVSGAVMPAHFEAWRAAR